MTDEPPPLVRDEAAALEAAEQRSLIDDVKQLAEDGRTLIEAEIAYQKTRAAVAGTGARGVATWGVLALSLGFFAMMGLVVGLLMGLTSVIGPWLATLVVVGVLQLAAIAAVLLARSRWKSVSAALSDKAPGA